MILTKDTDLPVVADEVLDYAGEVWMAQDKKPFRTFLAYLAMHISERSLWTDDDSRERREKSRRLAAR